MDHYSFATGADMAYTYDALALVAEYNQGNYPNSVSVESPDAAAAAEVESTLAWDNLAKMTKSNELA